jgi:hypothetical protein
MKPSTLATAFLVLSTACSENPRPTEELRIGVLIDDASPARASFDAAARLAETQLNQGLERAGSGLRIKVLTSFYGMGMAGAAATALVNEQAVRALVSDISGNTAAVNAFNYQSPPSWKRKVPVTCYQCSSAFFNDPAQMSPGYRDSDNWLYRTFFNATYESAVQIQMVLARPNRGDLDRDGHLKIAVYYDSFHLSAATTMPTIMGSLHQGVHSIELVAKTLPSTPATRMSELKQLLDSAPGSPAPDAVYLAFLPQNAPEALADFRASGSQVPMQANNGVRRDFLLPTLLQNGAEGLEGSSVRAVADSPAGKAFADAFMAATGQPPELTASYLFDAVAVQALAAAVATAGGQPLAQLSDESLRDALGRISDAKGARVEGAAAGFEQAARKIRDRQPIDYDGAASPTDLTSSGEMYPELVHWKIQDGRFVEGESWTCDPDHPNCALQIAR